MTEANRKPLRILMACGVPKRREGGGAAIAYNFGRELQQLGHEVTYIFLEDLARREEQPGRFAELVFSRRLARYIVRNAERFSVVHIDAPAGFIYGLRRRITSAPSWPPYVMILHGLEERRIHVMGREVRRGRAWHFAPRNRLWHRVYHQPRFSGSIRTADGAHTYSRDVWNMLQLKYGMDSDRVAYIPNGAEPRFFRVRSFGESPGLRLLYAGTWLDQRGIFYIRDALKHLAGRIPELRMTFAGCGVTEEEIRSFFGPELATSIIVRPVVPAERMPELYLEHDVFLFPSLMEGLPSVVLEAMATGMPVITTETCGMPDVIEDEFNGLLIPPANAEAIESAVLQLAGSLEMRQKIGCRAQDTMRRYTWERAGRQLEAFFYHIIEKSRA
jgi:glycosyltransferase involved in cell wall biosynthesis